MTKHTVNVGALPGTVKGQFVQHGDIFRYVNSDQVYLATDEFSLTNPRRKIVALSSGSLYYLNHEIMVIRLVPGQHVNIQVGS